MNYIGRLKTGKTDEELEEIAESYDFLEVQPPENDEYKIELRNIQIKRRYRKDYRKNSRNR